MANPSEAQAAFLRLLGIMDDLRTKCPWDREQTAESLRKLTIEETYELADAIDAGDWEELKKELGDLFLHLVFYSKLGEERGAFDVTEVLHGVCEKLIRRHPHIYGDVEATDSKAVKANWEAIKLQEKGAKRKSVLEGVPKALPAMVKAYRMQEKVQGVGFDWPDGEGVWAKVQEELQEMREATTVESETMELGDVLFALVNYAKHRGLDPEQALALSNAKFARRFQAMEALVVQEGGSVSEMDLDAWEALWQRVKATES
jgi:XTP/dITP diphosphohydrolase